MRISDWSSDVCSSDLRAVDHCPADIGLPTARWRGNADSYTAFFTECFIDEMATRAGSDALSYRMAMLGDAPLLARCLLTATTLGGWAGGLSGSAQGLACHAMRGRYISTEERRGGQECVVTL